MCDLGSPGEDEAWQSSGVVGQELHQSKDRDDNDDHNVQVLQRIAKLARPCVTAWFLDFYQNCGSQHYGDDDCHNDQHIQPWLMHGHLQKKLIFS